MHLYVFIIVSEIEREGNRGSWVGNGRKKLRMGTLRVNQTDRIGIEAGMGGQNRIEIKETRA